MTHESPSVAIVVLNYALWEDTLECVRSLLRLDYPEKRIIVVDNCSPDDSFERMAAWFETVADARQQEVDASRCGVSVGSLPPGVDPCSVSSFEIPGATGPTHLTLLASQSNGGFASGNNIGISQGLSCTPRADYVWLLNNDTVVDPRALSELVRSCEAYRADGQRIGILGSKLLHHHDPSRIQAIAGEFVAWKVSSFHVGADEIDVGQYDAPTVLSAGRYPIGASLFVCTAFVDEVGPLCEDYFLYFEELDWVRRGEAAGWGFAYCPASVVLHKEGGTTGTSWRSGTRKSDVSVLSSTRSRVLFVLRHHPRLIVNALFRNMLIAGWLAAVGRFRVALEIARTTIRTTWRGR